MKIAIINGPNLNLLGTREPGIYGNKTFESYMDELKNRYKNVDLYYFQSNVEGEIVTKIQEWGLICDGLLINAGAYTHTSIAIADAIAAIRTPAIEVHISNIFSREDHRHVSFLGAKCIGSISGFGLHSYRMGIDYFVSQKS